MDFTFGWNEVPGATGYNLQASLDPNFGSFILNETGITETSFEATGFGYDVTYFWRVQAINDAGLGDWSETWQLTTMALAVPLAPIQIAPVNGANDVQPTALFAWNAVDNAASYLLQVSKLIDFSSLELSVTTSETSHQALRTDLDLATSYFWRIQSLNALGQGTFSTIWSFITIATNVANEAEELPTEFGLEANYPNPFNPATTIRYALPESVPVRLAVYDVRGTEVAVLVDGMKPIGRHQVVWDARNLPSGTYIYRLDAGSFMATQKMMLVK
jgi:hypothetical protein